MGSTSMGGLVCLAALLAQAGLADDGPAQAASGRLSFSQGPSIDIGQDMALEDSALADLDGDGDLDLLIVRTPDLHGVRGTLPPDVPAVVAFRNDGAGGFSSMDLWPLTGKIGNSVGIDAADMDGDGDADILVWGTDQVWELRLYRNEGGERVTLVDCPQRWQWRFTEQGSGWIRGSDPPAFLVKGKRPGVLLAYSAPSGSIASEPITYHVPPELVGMLTDARVASWRDYDGDGSVDIATSPQVWGGGSLHILSGGAGGTFTEVTSAVVPPGVVPGQVDAFEGGDCEWADFDADGRPDLVVANYGNPMGPDPEVFLRNVGNGRLEWVREALGAEPPCRQITACVVADFDLDDDLDVFFLGMVSTNGYLAENLGDFHFAPRVVSGPDGDLWVNGHSVSHGDVDGDGDLDLFVSGSRRILWNEAVPSRSSEK